MNESRLIAFGDRSIGLSTLIATCYEMEAIHCDFKNILYDVVNPITYEASLDNDLMFEDKYVILLLFSIASPKSLENIRNKWYPDIRKYQQVKDVPVILVGTKVDLREDVAVLQNLRDQQLAPTSYRDGLLLAEEIEAVVYVECSSVTKYGLADLMYEIISLRRYARKRKTN